MSVLPPGGWCGTTPPGGRKKRSKTVVITFKNTTTPAQLTAVLATVATWPGVTYAGQPHAGDPLVRFKGSLTVSPDTDLTELFTDLRALPEVADVEEIVPLHDGE